MRKLVFFFLCLILLLSGFGFVFAQQKVDPVRNTISNGVEIDFFSSKTCPHCAKERAFLEQLQQKYPQVEIKEYEVIYNQENQKILEDFYEKYKVPEQEQGWVPVTFTPTDYFIGFSEDIGRKIEACLEKCLKDENNSPKEIKIPFLGNVDISKISLVGVTFLLGILDGFNPCAMWILVILISLLLPLKSRKRIALVGGVFIFAEGFLYFLFMGAWLNIFLAIEYGYLTRILIGIFGIGFGVWRIRDFLTWRPGVCKVTDHSSSQEKIVGRMEKVLSATTIPAIIFGVIILAFAVNLVEFLCSAGFPVMYTRILALQNIGAVQYYLYLFLYDILYMLDDLMVFGLAFFLFNRFSFSDKYNKYSTLVAGILILVLGVLMIFKPEILMFS